MLLLIEVNFIVVRIQSLSAANKGPKCIHGGEKEAIGASFYQSPSQLLSPQTIT